MKTNHNKRNGSFGAADLIALKPGQTLFVQVKSKDYLPPDEWNDLYRTAWDVGATPIHATVLPRKPIIWHELTAPKTVQTQNPPWQPWTPDQADNPCS